MANQFTSGQVSPQCNLPDPRSGNSTASIRHKRTLQMSIKIVKYCVANSACRIVSLFKCQLRLSNDAFQMVVAGFQETFIGRDEGSRSLIVYNLEFDCRRSKSDKNYTSVGLTSKSIAHADIDWSLKVYTRQWKYSGGYHPMRKSSHYLCFGPHPTTEAWDPFVNQFSNSISTTKKPITPFKCASISCAPACNVCEWALKVIKLVKFQPRGKIIGYSPLNSKMTTRIVPEVSRNGDN